MHADAKVDFRILNLQGTAVQNRQVKRYPMYKFR